MKLDQQFTKYYIFLITVFQIFYNIHLYTLSTCAYVPWAWLQSPKHIPTVNLMMCWEIMNDNLSYIFKTYLNNNLRTVVLWVATPCSLVGGHQSFGETHHLHLYLVPYRWRQYSTPEHEYQPTTKNGVITQRIRLWTFITASTSNPMNNKLLDCMLSNVCYTHNSG